MLPIFTWTPNNRALHRSGNPRLLLRRPVRAGPSRNVSIGDPSWDFPSWNFPTWTSPFGELQHSCCSPDSLSIQTGRDDLGLPDQILLNQKSDLKTRFSSATYPLRYFLKDYLYQWEAPQDLWIGVKSERRMLIWAPWRLNIGNAI